LGVAYVMEKENASLNADQKWSGNMSTEAAGDV
jgi:hypothetical protein